MNRIRWEGQDGYWDGYLGSIPICYIIQKATLAYDGHSSYKMFFHLQNGTTEYFTKLSSAKRGAERMLDKFLKDAGLEAKS